jgi:8-oxo-dGTP pyrophosphatase MutT (NUDIX family)
MFQQFIQQLKNQLKAPLPGENAQFAMAPLSRERMKELNFEALKPKKSAILVLIYPHENEIKTVLIQRPTYQGVHSGQIAFPGGKFEEPDIHLKNTALREANEEIGIEPTQIEIIGNLSNVYINPSNFLVTPFIGHIGTKPDFSANEREVEKIIETNLLQLDNPERKGIKTISHSSGYKIKSPYYDVEGHTVWGATAMMISELNEVLRNI